MAITKTTKPIGLAYQTETRTPEQIAQQAQAATTPAKPTRYTTPVQDVSSASPGQTPLPTRNSLAPRTASTITRPTGPTPVNENAIREETRQRMQSSIDAINANYANLISQEKVAGVDRSGQTRAMNARGGLMGSDFGAANQEKITQYNKQQQQALIDRKNADIQSVMDKIEDRAAAAIKSRKEEALGQYNRDLDAFKETQAQARSDLKILADKRVNLAELAPAQKAALLKQAGYDDPQWGELIYNAMKPKAAQIDYKFEKLNDGMGLFYGQDPETGELKQIKVPVDLPADWQIQIAPDGTVIGFDKNTGEAKLLSEQGQFADPTKWTDSPNNPFNQLSPDIALKLGLPTGTTKKDALPFIKEHNAQITAAKDALPRVDEVLGLIKTVYNHPGIGEATGAFRLGTLLPNSSGRDFIAKFDQLKAMLSLDNIKYLKGTGSISDAEQQLLANAASSLRRSTSTGAFKTELQRLYETTSAYKQKLVEKSVSGTLDAADEFDSQYEGGGSEGTNPKAQAFSPAISQPLASSLSQRFPAGSVGGQCGDFVRKLANSFGINYPRLGNTLSEKLNAVQKYGTSPDNAKIGSVIVTKENPTYGHVAWIIGANDQGYIVAESNFKQSNKISYGRTIPFNSSKIIGVINPTA